MSDLRSKSLDLTFAALADPTRRAILARLAIEEASVNEIAEPFKLSQPAISKHLKVLERAGLISKGRVAQRRPRRLGEQGGGADLHPAVVGGPRPAAAAPAAAVAGR